MPKKTGIVIFDLDGTLVDTRHDLTAATNAMRAEFDLPPLPLETVVGYVGNGLMKLVERALSDSASPLSLTAGADRFREYYGSNLLNKTALYPGIREALEQLTALKVPMGIITNKPEQPARQICIGLGIAHVFQFIFGGDTCATRKPHPGPLLEAIKLCEAEIEESWMVGDNYTDIAAASAAGMRSCYCEYGFGNLGAEKPDIYIDAPMHLVKVLVPPRSGSPR